MNMSQWPMEGRASDHQSLILRHTCTRTSTRNGSQCTLLEPLLCGRHSPQDIFPGSTGAGQLVECHCNGAISRQHTLIWLGMILQHFVYPLLLTINKLDIYKHVMSFKNYHYKNSTSVYMYLHNGSTFSKFCTWPISSLPHPIQTPPFSWTQCSPWFDVDLHVCILL